MNIPPLIVEPEQGVAPIEAFIRSAKTSLLIKQFTFDQPRLLDAVEQAHAQGVDVRVMLNPHRSSGSRANDATYERLQKAGIAVKWTNPKFAVTHEKSIVVDKTRALIATFNLMDKYFTRTRDYGVVIVNPAQVAQVVEGFEADWHEREFHPHAASGLLWSNNNSRHLMCDFIDNARETLDIQHPKFVDATVLERILAARERDVKVRVLCGGRHGISDWDILDTFSSLRVMQRFGVKVHKQKNLRLHAKLLIADDKHALLGSMNIDRSAFDLRRELGVIIHDPVIVDGLRKVFEGDWESSRRYEAPDPLQHDPALESQDFPHDPDLIHE